MTTKTNRYANVQINVISKNKDNDCSIALQKLYQIILHSKANAS
jgi:hypothetical protein